MKYRYRLFIFQHFFKYGSNVDTYSENINIDNMVSDVIFPRFLGILDIDLFWNWFLMIESGVSEISGFAYFYAFGHLKLVFWPLLRTQIRFSQKPPILFGQIPFERLNLTTSFSKQKGIKQAKKCKNLAQKLSGEGAYPCSHICPC